MLCSILIFFFIFFVVESPACLPKARMLQAHVQFKVWHPWALKHWTNWKMQHATYWTEKSLCLFFNKKFQKVFFKKKGLLKKKEAPVCFIGFKVLLCVYLPCVSTCRLRAKSLPQSFFKCHFACWNFKVLLFHKLQNNFLGFWHTRLNIIVMERKIPVSWIWLLNLEVILATLKSLLFHNSLSISFRPLFRVQRS